MKKIFVSFVAATLIVFGMSSLSVVAAATCPFGGSPNWQGVCDTTTDSGQEYHGPTMTEEESKTYTENNSPVNNSLNQSTTNNSTPNEIVSEPNEIVSENFQNLPNTHLIEKPIGTFIPLTPEYNDSAWAVIDKNNNVLNIISCSNLTCGSNSWHKKAIEFGIFPEGSKLVFQRWAEKDNNVSGYINAQYDETNRIWTVEIDESIYQISENSDDQLNCIQNCKNLENNTFETKNNNILVENNENIFVPMIFATNLKPNTITNIVATNKNKTKIWKTKVSKSGKIKIKINKKFIKWKFRVKVGS